MGLKIRLRQQGRTNAKAYRLVLADTRSPRDGKYVEMLGWYHPQQSGDKEAHVESERVAYWLKMGAEPTEKVVSLLARHAPEASKEYREMQVRKQAKRVAQRRKKKSA